MSATPRPWRHDLDGEVIRGADDAVVHAYMGHGDPVAEPDADLIVRAVNAHDALVEVEKRARAMLEFYDEFIADPAFDGERVRFVEPLRAALAAARGTE